MQARIDRIEEKFGYPFPPSLRRRIEETLAARKKAPEEADGTFIGAHVDWKAEHWEGPDPERAAVEALFGRLKRPVPLTALRPKTPDLLARHFCGLFKLRLIRDFRGWAAV